MSALSSLLRICAAPAVLTANALLSVPVNAAPENVEKIYRNFCSSCHGAQMQGAMGPSLVDGQWVHGASDEDIANVIKNGVPKKGMPAWRKSLSDAEIRALVILMRESAAEKPSELQQSSSGVFEAAGHKFMLQKVAEAPGQIWSMDFLPDGRLIATQRDGKLWLFDSVGDRQLVQGTPKVWYQGQGGLLDVVVHPQFAKNGWIYLSLSDPAASGAMTKLVRGKIEGTRWVEEQNIFLAPKDFYSQSGVHFGSRIVFTDEHLFFSVGDRGQRSLAQDLSSPYGKIHRLQHDGTVPKDNPFEQQVRQKPYLASIWSYGHRNPQGLALHPQTQALWAAEHGPRGGDEINLVNKGMNYGWPVISYGMNYDGSPLVDKTAQEGMQQPKHYWVPSIAVSEIDFYTGSVFPKWQNQLLVGSLAQQQLRLLSVSGEQVTSDQLLFKGLGRIRDLADGPDGHPYLVLNNDSGAIFRVQPVVKGGAE